MTEKGQEQDIALSSTTVSALRSALNHLYDPSSLQQNPLAKTLGSRGRASTASELRQILTDAIETLKPEDGTPPQSLSWRMYEILHYRYVQQCSQEEVADQIGLSVRHLKREQSRAIELLADRLCRTAGLDAVSADVRAELTARGDEAPAPTASELQWLTEAPPSNPTELTAVLSPVLELVQPIAARYGVRIFRDSKDALPALAVHAVGLRQMLLNVLSVAIHQTVGGRLMVSSVPRKWDVEILFRSGGRQERLPPAPGDEANLGLARQMASASGGSLVVAKSGAFSASLVLPAAEQTPVLVIDDSLDTLHLFQRYAIGTRYLVSGTQYPEQVLTMPGSGLPQIIVLDVMMPETDGWEILGRLRQHPLTSRTPIVACTILAQEELALALGAAAFLRKPVNRRDFLSALDCVRPLAAS